MLGSSRQYRGDANGVFVFKAGFGNDTITDFAGSQGAGDVIEFDDVFANFAALQAAGGLVTSRRETRRRDALRLTILPLIQVTTLPRLVMRSPESLALTRPRSVLLRHLALLNLQIESENRSRPRAVKQVCEESTLSAPGGRQGVGGASPLR